MTYYSPIESDAFTLDYVKGFFNLVYINITKVKIFDSLEKAKKQFPGIENVVSNVDKDIVVSIDFSYVEKQIEQEAKNIWASITDEDINVELAKGALVWDYPTNYGRRVVMHTYPAYSEQLKGIASRLFSNKVKEYPFFKIYNDCWVSPKVKFVTNENFTKHFQQPSV